MILKTLHTVKFIVKPNHSEVYIDANNISHSRKMFAEGFAYKRVIFGFIAVVAIFGNSIFCTVLARKRVSLRRPYNKLLLSLAVTDLLTGFLITFTPNFIWDKDMLDVPSNFFGEFYCRVIYNRLLLFLFGKASILTATCLAVERWYSVVKPIKYRIAFTHRRLRVSISCIWLASVLLQMPKGFTIAPYKGSCVANYSHIISSQTLSIIYVWVTFLIPSCIIWCTFVHIWTKFRKKSVMPSGELRKMATQRMMGVCGVAACMMTLCWLPVQITYILSRFRIIDLDSKLHAGNQMLAMANSCINPWIFCFANKEYREAVLGFLGSSRRFQLPSKSGQTVFNHDVSHDHVTEKKDVPLQLIHVNDNNTVKTAMGLDNYVEKESFDTIL